MKSGSSSHVLTRKPVPHHRVLVVGLVLVRLGCLRGGGIAEEEFVSGLECN